MEEFPERADLRRMQREQERERRRIRDRQRRQSMTQEQRERHLARRRRNYQLRRQRAANAPFIPLPQPQGLESSTGEASTSDELQGATSSTSSDYRLLYHGPHGIALPHHGLNQGQETLNLGTTIVEGSSAHLEALACRPTNSPTRLRLNHVRRLARSLTRRMGDPLGSHQVAAELIAKEDTSAGDYGSRLKSLRLNCVKRLARSINSPPKATSPQKNHVEQKLPRVGIQSLGNESCIVSS